MPFNGRTIVCLCGSARFGDAYIKANHQETMNGKIVLSVGCFNTYDSMPLVESHITQEEKQQLDKLHFDKIAMADEILVLSVGGYIGESTINEIKYAIQNRKSIRFLESDAIPDWFSDLTNRLYYAYDEENARYFAQM